MYNVSSASQYGTAKFPSTREIKPADSNGSVSIISV